MKKETRSKMAVIDIKVFLILLKIFFKSRKGCVKKTHPAVAKARERPSSRLV